MIVNLDPRAQKALELAATAAYTWERLPSGAFRIPSQYDAGVTYVASAQVCTCPDFSRRQQPCKHVTAACIISTLMAATEPAPTRPTGLVATREPDGTIGWDRPVRAPISGVAS